jgi:hypothetical protein
MAERFSSAPSTKGGYIKKAMAAKAKGPSAKVVSADKAALLAKHESEKAKFEDKHGPQDWTK